MSLRCRAAAWATHRAGCSGVCTTGGPAPPSLGRTRPQLPYAHLRWYCNMPAPHPPCPACQVTVPLPDEEARAAILGVHLRRVPLASQHDRELACEAIAKITAGAHGAAASGCRGRRGGGRRLLGRAVGANAHQAEAFWKRACRKLHFRRRPLAPRLIPPPTYLHLPLRLPSPAARAPTHSPPG